MYELCPLLRMNTAYCAYSLRRISIGSYKQQPINTHFLLYHYLHYFTFLCPEMQDDQPTPYHRASH